MTIRNEKLNETNLRCLSKIVTKLQVTEGNNPQRNWGKLANIVKMFLLYRLITANTIASNEI